jgi:hypothetical protein
MDNLFLGKLPAREGAVKLNFTAYANMGALPNIPNDFGHEEYVPPIDWKMLANDKVGDCVVAGGAHEHMLWNQMAGNTLTFNDRDVLHDYTAITGLPPNPLTGADMQQAASYRLKTGLLGADGQRHKIAAYVRLRPGNLQELYAAMYLFGAVGVGIRFPQQWFGQFTRREAWRITSGMTFTGMGHYVPCMALRSNIVCVTWGRFQALRPSAYSYLCDEAIAYISEESLVQGKSPEGFDLEALLADARAITGA